MSTIDFNDRKSPTRIAAEARQLFRALVAKDQDAIAVCLFHFENLLVSSLTCYLKEDPRWDPDRSQLENPHDGWWIDFLAKSRLVIAPPVWLQVQSDALWYNDRNLPDPSPLRFDLELCPVTGSALWHAIYFGDAEAFGHRSETTLDDGICKEWAFMYPWGCRSASLEGLQKHTLTEEQLADGQSAIFAEHDDPLADCDVWLAALVRQQTRATSARDSDAIALSLLYFRHCLRSTLERTLRRDTRWKESRDVFGRSRIEGLKGNPIHALTDRRFVFHDDVILHDLQRDRSYEEPIEFELELDRVGSFLESVIRFGRGTNGEWEFVFHRRSPPGPNPGE